MTGHADLARWREAYVRAHVTSKTAGPPGVLCQLPADLTTWRPGDLATFTGPAEALAKLADLVGAKGSGDGAMIAAIEGMAGVGKTQLAVHAAHELTRAGKFAAAQLYVNLRGFDAERPPAEPADVLDMFLTLRCSGCSVCWDCIPATISPPRPPPRWPEWTWRLRWTCSACYRKNT